MKKQKWTRLKIKSEDLRNFVSHFRLEDFIDGCTGSYVTLTLTGHALIDGDTFFSKCLFTDNTVGKIEIPYKNIVEIQIYRYNI